MSSDDQDIIELLGPREVIGQAIAVLMATNDVSRDTAIETLVRDSCASQRTVREVAAAIAGQGRRIIPPGSDEVRSRALGAARAGWLR